VTYETNIREHLHLRPNMLPVYPFVVEPALISPGDKLDDLFRGGSYFSVSSLQLKKKLTIRSPELNYWQVYTPD